MIDSICNVIALTYWPGFWLGILMLFMLLPVHAVIVMREVR